MFKYFAALLFDSTICIIFYLYKYKVFDKLNFKKISSIRFSDIKLTFQIGIKGALPINSLKQILATTGNYPYKGNTEAVPWADATGKYKY